MMDCCSLSQVLLTGETEKPSCLNSYPTLQEILIGTVSMSPQVLLTGETVATVSPSTINRDNDVVFSK